MCLHYTCTFCYRRFPIFLMNFPKSFKGLGSTSSIAIRNKKVAACMFQIGLLSELNR